MRSKNPIVPNGTKIIFIKDRSTDDTCTHGAKVGDGGTIIEYCTIGNTFSGYDVIVDNGIKTYSQSFIKRNQFKIA